MKILVTGGTGFLGTHVRDEFMRQKPGITSQELVMCNSKSCNLMDLPSTLMAFEREQPDIVIHLAALCGGIGFNKTYPADVLQTNLTMAVNLFEAVGKYHPKYVYTAGSVCSYPRDCPVPFSEDNLWNGYPEETNAGYGFSKKALLMLQQEYRKQYGVLGAHFVVVNLYGPNDKFDLQNGHVIAALIMKFLAAVKHNKPTVECWGTGQATREFFYVKDCARAFVKAALSSFDSSAPINLGSGKDISIFNLAHLIAKLTGYKGKVVFTGEVSDGQPKRQLDVNKAKQILDFKAETSLVDGLRNTIEWYKTNSE